MLRIVDDVPRAGGEHFFDQLDHLVDGLGGVLTVRFSLARLDLYIALASSTDRCYSAHGFFPGVAASRHDHAELLPSRRSIS